MFKCLVIYKNNPSRGLHVNFMKESTFLPVKMVGFVNVTRTSSLGTSCQLSPFLKDKILCLKKHEYMRGWRPQKRSFFFSFSFIYFFKCP